MKKRHKYNRKDKYISRVLFEKTNGYQVRMPEVANGKAARHSKESVNKLFSLSHYKDLAACLRAATRWRNKYLKENDGLYLLKQSMHRDMPFVTSIRNTSGAIGVALMASESNDTVYYCYSAQWADTTVSYGHKSKRFACIKYGFEEAFKMACRFRFEHCGPIVITSTELIPCYPDVPYVIEDKDVS